MTVHPNLKGYYENLMTLVKDFGPEAHQQAFVEVVEFMLHIVAVDGKVSKFEAVFISELIDHATEIKEIAEMCESLDWQEFVVTRPLTLELLKTMDDANGNAFEDSGVKLHIQALNVLGLELAKADGIEMAEKKKITDYISFLESEAKKMFKGTPKGNKKAGTPRKTAAKAAPEAKASVAKPQEKSKAGPAENGDGWIPMSTHIPTGNFLDDTFRHSALTHEDRIDLWKSITGDALPCVRTTDIKFRKPAWFGPEEDNSLPILQVHKVLNMPLDEPTYFYGYVEAYPPSKLGGFFYPAGMLVNYNGIFIFWSKQEQLFLPWDRIELIQDLDYSNEEIGIVTMFINVFHSEKDLYFATLGEDVFYFSFSLEDAFYSTKVELDNLLAMMRTRLKQSERSRGSSIKIDLGTDFRYLTEAAARDLCLEFLQKKGHGMAAPNAKTAVAKPKTKTKAGVAKPPAKPKPAQAPKPVAKEKISIPQTGPTTKLDFWQALKPYLDKLKHQEFSRIALKDVDYLDARPTVIAGVYNSIIMRVGKKILRLMVTINTDTAAGNLKIIDHVQKNIKIPVALKGRVEFDRKEGRHSQIIMLNFDGFELSDRGCWSKYISELMGVADDFFDAAETPMRDLI